MMEQLKQNLNRGASNSKITTSSAARIPIKKGDIKDYF